MVGRLGEYLLTEAYGLQVEIKATQSRSVAFRSCPEHAIVINIQKDGSFAELFNGPGHVIWERFKGRELPSNAQYQITTTRSGILHDRLVSRNVWKTDVGP